MSTKLSLICPMYKVSEYLEELIDSLISGANSKYIEVLFIDDCCPENSKNFCLDYLLSQREKVKFRYQVIRLETNVGIGSARNVGLSISSGEYIGFIDADDVVSKNYWEKVKCHLCDGSVDVIEFGFREFSQSYSYLTGKCVLPSSVSIPELIPFINGFFAWRCIFKRESIGDLTFPKKGVYEDIYFSIKAFSKVKKSITLENVLLFYRKREESITGTRDANYALLLSNIVLAVTESIESSASPHDLLYQVSRYSTLMYLKGMKISDTHEREKFFLMCNDSLNSFIKLSCRYKFELKRMINLYICKFIYKVNRLRSDYA